MSYQHFDIIDTNLTTLARYVIVSDSRIRGTLLASVLTVSFLCCYMCITLYQDSVTIYVKQDCDIDRYNVSDLQRKFPRLFIIGFGKSGTYALTKSLQMHPSIIGKEAQEIKYFDYLYSNGLCWYIGQMRDPGPSQFMLEDSPSYILHCSIVFPRLTEALKHFNLGLSDLKFIVIVRHPIVRAISDFVHWKLHKPNNTKSFDDMAIDSKGHPILKFGSTSKSRYSFYIKQCLEFVPSNQICFVNGDMLKTSPVLTMNKLEKCLGLPSNISSDNFVFNRIRKNFCFIKNSEIECPSTSKKGRPHPKITRRTADILMKFYEPYNKELYEITGEDYGWDYNYDEIDIAD
ncbi:heparan sulfate glucosamine 3-O-sulfotransferase 5-like [Dysidea avara]|uniref:heparan sulfate glucosamine 3-O-sulfotransferase 5-like n=1 Tax=Dysidea avara TaxID=196820 RepID=UPI00332E6FB0